MLPLATCLLAIAKERPYIPRMRRREILSELKLMRDFLLFPIRWTSQYLGKVSDCYDNALPQGMPRINRSNDI